ncbi:MAG: hypothetical protein HS116_02305 [Planctomycetes bacterium]|nr:hypothetical protein [Planctomycetota bacterium]
MKHSTKKDCFGFDESLPVFSRPAASAEGVAYVCAWCNRVMRDAKAGQVVSHGCCKKCSEKVRRDLSKEPKR